MKNMPFTTSIGTDFLYKNPLQNDVKQKLGLTVDSNSFALLTGRPGIGKSTALRLYTKMAVHCTFGSYGSQTAYLCK